MSVESFGLLLFRRPTPVRPVEVFLIKPNWRTNGPAQNFWGFPKGRKEFGERPLQVALREFQEEVGMPAPQLHYTPLKPITTRQKKIITIFSGDATGHEITWNGSAVATRSFYEGGAVCEYAETSAGEWFPIETALKVIGRGQRSILEDFIRTRLRITTKTN